MGKTLQSSSVDSQCEQKKMNAPVVIVAPHGCCEHLSTCVDCGRCRSSYELLLRLGSLVVDGDSGFRNVIFL